MAKENRGVTKPTKKRGGKRREGLSSRYCCTVQYLQVPWLPQGFSSQPVGCSHCGLVQPSEQVQVWLPPSAL